MAAYLIVDIDVHDTDAYKTYVGLVPPLVTRHGGTYLVRGGAHEIIEGDWAPNRMVVLQFPDATAAHAFVDDPDYAPVKAIRHRCGAQQHRAGRRSLTTAARRRTGRGRSASTAHGADAGLRSRRRATTMRCTSSGPS